MSKQIKVFVEDSLMQKDEIITAGSKILSGFKSPFSATVVERLSEAGIKVEKRVAMDEFGVDDFFSDEDDILPAIRAVMEDEDVCVLCNDIFGKVRRQAALNGVYYIKPSYGMVSRYGLVPSVSSMDQVGILCADLGKGFTILAKIIGKDDKDGAMWPTEDNCLMPAVNEVKKSENDSSSCQLRVAVPENVWREDAEIIHAQLEKKFKVDSMKLDYFDIYHQVLYILSSAEFSNNTNRYDGVKFGYRSNDGQNLNDLYFNTRSEGFTLNTKLAIIMGAGVLSQENYQAYYEKAMKIRRLIKESVKFENYDMIALPVEVKGKSKYELSALSALTALAGLPSLTVPYGDGGFQFIANMKKEDILLDIKNYI